MNETQSRLADGVVDPAPAEPTLIGHSVAEPPGRAEVTVSRIVRDSEKASQVKQLHGHQCQICGDRLKLKDGYAWLRTEVSDGRVSVAAEYLPDEPEAVVWAKDVQAAAEGAVAGGEEEQGKDAVIWASPFGVACFRARYPRGRTRPGPLAR